MTVAVILPYGGDCPHRARALEWVRDRYEWPTVVGYCDGPWCKAVAVHDALTRTDADILVVADADVWAEHLPEAVQAVTDGALWAVPHRKVHRLSEEATQKVLAGEPPGLGLTRDQHPYPGVVGGGMVVLRRETYEQVPLDPRFVGWGGEDQAWGSSLSSMLGIVKHSHGPLWHLWHPPAERATRRVGSSQNEELRRRYASADGNRDVISLLLEEARNVLSSSPHETVHGHDQYAG